MRAHQSPPPWLAWRFDGCFGTDLLAEVPAHTHAHTPNAPNARSYSGGGDVTDCSACPDGTTTYGATCGAGATTCCVAKPGYSESRRSSIAMQSAPAGGKPALNSPIRARHSSTLAPGHRRGQWRLCLPLSGGHLQVCRRQHPVPELRPGRADQLHWGHVVPRLL